MFSYKKFIFRLSWLLPLFLANNFIFASEKNGDNPQIFAQKGQIHLTRGVILYDSLKETKPLKINVVKNNNSQKLKVGSKKSIAKAPTKKTEKPIPVFNLKQIKQSNPTESFSILVNDGLKAIQNNRERKYNKSALAKIYDYCFFYKIISDGFVTIRSNHHEFDNHYKRLFCRPPPILYS